MFAREEETDEGHPNEKGNHNQSSLFATAITEPKNGTNRARTSASWRFECRMRARSQGTAPNRSPAPGSLGTHRLLVLSSQIVGKFEQATNQNQNGCYSQGE